MQDVDIIVVGAGFFGVCVSLLLSQSGYQVALFSQTKDPLQQFLDSLRVCWPSLNDPPTRANAAHGQDMALYLQNFCSLGNQFLKEHFFKTFGLEEDWQEITSLRFGLQNFEQEELLKAEILGFSLQRSHFEKSIFVEGKKSLICLNGYNFIEKIRSFIQQKKISFLQEKVFSIEENSDGCIVNKKLKSELVILANGLGISELLPKFKDILVPMSDVFLSYKSKGKLKQKLVPISLRGNSGHMAVCLYQDTDGFVFLRVSGPRFLLPMAGAGVLLRDIAESVYLGIQEYHKKNIFPLLHKLGYHFLNFEDFFVTKKTVKEDCLPCDELPLLGEFGKFGKILGHAGWLGAGFSSGAWAAKILSDIINFEDKKDLHPRLEPRRFHLRKT